MRKAFFATAVVLAMALVACTDADSPTPVMSSAMSPSQMRPVVDTGYPTTAWGLCVEVAKTEPLPCGPGAEMMVQYRFTVFTHCGIQSAIFDGREWRIDRPQPTAPSNVAGGNGLRGTMELVAPDRAVFRADPGVEAEFRLETADDPEIACF